MRATEQILNALSHAVSSTLVDIPDFGSILLDAGEGTLGQLRRRFGTEGVQQVYGRLRILYISHMHADHHIGLRRLLLDRLRVSNACWGGTVEDLTRLPPVRPRTHPLHHRPLLYPTSFAGKWNRSGRLSGQDEVH